MNTGDERPAPPLKTKPGRIGGFDWQIRRHDAAGIFNSNYGPGGERLGDYDEPWRVVGEAVYEKFHTWDQAAAYAFRGAEG